MSQEPSKSSTKNQPAKKPAKKSNKVPKMIDVISKSLDDAKGEDIVVIDIRGKSSIADYMVIASGRVHRHVGAIANQLSRALHENGFDKPRVEGLNSCDWVLLDAGDVIVHVFRPEVREFYNIEKMWSGEFNDDNS